MKLQLLTLATLVAQASAFSWEYCDNFERHVDIHSLEVIPSPLQSNGPVMIKMNATLGVDINEDAYIKGIAKYLFIQVPIPQTKICEKDSVICPLKAGTLYVEDVDKLPDNLPQGEYKVHIEAYNGNEDAPLLCINAVAEVGESQGGKVVFDVNGRKVIINTPRRLVC